MLDVKRLGLLVELSRRGTIAAVAQALSYSPSAISQQLALLEKEAGVALLEPFGRRVRLTAQGELLVGHAEVVLAELERAEAGLEVTELELSLPALVAGDFDVVLGEEYPGHPRQRTRGASRSAGTPVTNPTCATRAPTCRFTSASSRTGWPRRCCLSSPATPGMPG